MMGDSTNVERKGVSGSERDVIDGFEEVFTSARGRIVIAMFSSSLYRMQILVDLADQFDRKVAFVGRGVIENSQIAMRLGYLRMPPGVQIRDSEIKSYPSQDVVDASAPARRGSRRRRCRGSPSTITATRRSTTTTWWCSRRGRSRATRRRSAG